MGRKGRDGQVEGREAVPVSDELKVELDRRLAEFEADPEAGSPWEEVRERILQGRWRAI
ncbi:MAG TPA: addiction module protein [Thermoanaerobaculia bacterium]|jgi:putative addiction module component (TIGR02574 family)